MKQITVGKIELANDKPFVLIAGLNVLENNDLTMRVAEALVSATGHQGIPYIFKASFDKANRSSAQSYRGVGLDEGLRILDNVRTGFDVPILTDVHAPQQAAAVAEICDILQLPAFLARQTDLVAAIARTGAAVNVKKPQFMSPPQIGNVVEKLREYGNERVLLCERGTCFGYDNLVVDMLGIQTMKTISGGAPIVFDVTHALQMRDPSSPASGGRRQQMLELARAGLGVGLAGLFLETHPDPDKALCDGPSATPLEQVPVILAQLKQLDDLVKSFPAIDIH